MSDAQPSLSPLGALLVTLGGAVLVLAGMRAAASVVGPLLIALLITIAWSPASAELRRRGWPPTLAALTGIVVSVAALALFAILVWTSLEELQRKLPEYQPRVEAIQASLAQRLATLPFESSHLLSAEILQPGTLVGTALQMIRRLTEAAGTIALLGLLMAFMMIESVRYPEKLQAAFSYSPEARLRVTRFGQSMRSYIVINTIFGLIAAVANTVLLMALGVDFPILWGVISFLLSFVPNIGVLISVVPPALLALLQFGFGRAMGVVVGFIAINFLVDNVLKPRYVGESLNLTPIVVVVSLIFWGWLLGPLGALVAVPLSIALKFLFETFEESRWLANLMSDNNDPPVMTLPPLDHGIGEIPPGS
ncbi:MAG: AI-2E family transporter [Gemmatimonadota bacterium]|nr:AI-2E family transporter [Gemmatimonadota bacterium]